MAESKVSMKLLINSQTNRVLFAEAGKECVDFLFHILSLPLATVIRLLKKQGMVGCLSNLYKSVENLNETYIQPDKNKDALLKPIVTTSVPMFLLKGARKRQPTGKVIYWRDDCCDPDDLSGEGGFVKGVVTYIVMDDLVVKPMSTISSLTLLNKFNVNDVGACEQTQRMLSPTLPVASFNYTTQNFKCRQNVSSLYAKHGRVRGTKRVSILSALPETVASIAELAIAGTIVGVAATFLMRRRKTSEAAIETPTKICEDCKGSGVCSECNGEGFVLKRLSKENVERARLMSKNATTRYTVGLPKKWSYCTKCSFGRSCSTCGGSGNLAYLN